MSRYQHSRKDNVQAGTGSASSRFSGIVLLVTLVVLMVLAAMGYNLASRVAAQRHRDNYIIDYTSACYARDSAMKYALATLQDLKDIELIARPNEPDFSDLFALSELDYRRLLEEWAKQIAESQPESSGVDSNEPFSGLAGLEGINDINLEELFTGEANVGGAAGPNAIDMLRIPGPYGPPWPCVTESVEFEIGSATVKIEIEDENAKYPAGWGMLDDEKVRREAETSLETFCEWMGLDAYEISSVKEQLAAVSLIRPFKVEFKPVRQRTAVRIRAPASRRRGRRQRTVYKTTVTTPAEQLVKQARDVSKLLHSSLIDTEMLAEPTVISEDRQESALKYMSLWGTTQVNINSAPRQVLEAAFVFGGDADRIAAEIIERRRKKPFKDIEELKNELFRFSDTIEKCRPYITTASNTFTIHVTAASGVAKTSGVIVVLKQGAQIHRIAVISG